MADPYEALKLRNQVCFPLYACSKELVRQYGPFLRDLGLTYTQYIVMMVLWERETVSSRDLAECLHLDYGTLTPVLRRLSQAGYLTRERSGEDERLLTLTVTESGKALREKAVSIPPAVAGCVGLTPEEFQTLYILTYKALHNMESRRKEQKEEMKMAKIYEFSVKDRKGNQVSLGDYAGKVLLIVNTATGCGFTPHYEPLEAMYRDLRDQGLEILDFPCNQFANQAPGTEDEIHEFCTLKFGADFPQFAKTDVNGETADPLFAYLAGEKPFAGFGKGLKNAAMNKFSEMNNKKFGDKAYIRWNFTKFLVSRQGEVIARFEPTADMAEVRKAVEDELKK